MTTSGGIPATAPSRALARQIRLLSLQMVARAKTSHIGSCLSVADVLAVLYSGILRVDGEAPGAAERDRLIVSKGHAAAAVYAALASKGFIPRQALETFSEDGSTLLGHVSHGVPGVELSTGALGHGLPVGCGLALAAARGGRPFRTFVVLSDGECDEGSNWEAALFAAHFGLDGLTAVVDANGMQGFGAVDQVLRLEPLADKWRAFGWAVREVDGHDHQALQAALSGLPAAPGKPTLVLARTVKGKGVDFMERSLAWHYRSPSAELLAQALRQVGGEPPGEGP